MEGEESCYDLQVDRANSGVDVAKGIRCIKSIRLYTVNHACSDLLGHAKFNSDNAQPTL